MKRILNLTHSQIGGEDIEVHTTSDGQPYDVVFTDRLAELFFTEADAHIAECVTHLVDEGQLHLYAPSLEWYAQEIMAQRVGEVLYAAMWGFPEVPRHSGWLLVGLRRLLFENGLIVQSADSEPYPIAHDAAGVPVHAERHVVVAVLANRGGAAWTPS